MKQVIRTEIAEAIPDDQIKVSLIVPCYKVEEYLSRCLDTLTAQTLEGVEVICINDGSPDTSIEILKRYQELFPKIIVIIDKDNEGVWKGRKDGIAIARGDYIGFVDSDDYVELDYCESLYRCALDNEADISVCGFYREDVDTGKILTTEMDKKDDAFLVLEQPERLLELNGAPWNKLFRAELLRSFPDLSEPPKIFDDMMMHLLIYPNVQKIAFCPKALVHYIIRGDSIMTTIRADQIESTYRAMKEIKEIYLKQTSGRLLEFLEVSAFLHLGVSLMFRVSCDPGADIKETLVRNKNYLDANFAGWRTSKMISFKSAWAYGGVFAKLYLVRLIYKAHLMRAFLVCYKGMIARGVDIKW